MSARALRILRRVAEKHAEMFQTCLASGLKVTADFHERIRSNYGASTSSSAGVWPAFTPPFDHPLLQSWTTTSWRANVINLTDVCRDSPCHVQKTGFPQDGVLTIVVNGAECSPVRLVTWCCRCVRGGCQWPGRPLHGAGAAQPAQPHQLPCQPPEAL